MANALDFYDREMYLAHYGIKGQKWGVRRFQNSDGTWTAEGKARYGDSGMTRQDKKAARAEYKADNKQAYEYGRSATIAGRAASYAQKKEAKAQKKYDRHKSAKNADRLKIAKKLRKDWDAEAKRTQKQAEEHRKSLVSKYGKDHVSDLKFDKKGRVNARVHTGKDFTSSWLKSLGAGAVATLLGSPVSLMYYPATKNQMGKQAYQNSYNAETWNYNNSKIITANKHKH